MAFYRIISLFLCLLAAYACAKNKAVVTKEIHDALYDLVEENPELPNQWIDTLFNRVDQHEPRALITCTVCTTLIDLAQTVISEGLDYADVREDLHNLCHGLIYNFTNINHNILCPGILDNYAPQIINILRLKNMTTRHFCTKLQYCEDEDYVTIIPPNRLAAMEPNLFMRPRFRPRTRRQNNGDIVIVHLTDIHVDFLYAEGSATECNLPTCCHENYPGQGSAKHWGEYVCNIPTKTGLVFLDAIANMDPKPDFILYSGDTPSHALWEETQWGQLNYSKWLSESFRAKLQGVRVFPAIGNHESYPANMYFVGRPEIQEFNIEFASWYEDLAQFGQEQMNTMRDAGYYCMQIRAGLWILGYNSNYGYTTNWYNVLNDEYPEWPRMTSYVEAQMSNIRDLGHKVILIGHHPFGGSGTMKYYETFLYDLLLRYGDVIMLHVMGHTHSDEFRVVVDESTGEARSVQNVGPTGGALFSQNPGARIYYMDPTTFQVKDYDQYIFNLTKYTDFDDIPVLDRIYRASDEYNMAGFTPQHWLDLTDRFENDWDLYNKYRANVNGRSGMQWPCDDTCRARDLCKMRSATAAQSKACYAAIPRADEPYTGKASKITAFYSLLLGLFPLASLNHVIAF